MAITVSGTTITFNDATTQTTSAIPSSISAVGAVVSAANTTTSNLLPGNTIAGSSLYYPSTITGIINSRIYTEGSSSLPTTFTVGLSNKYLIGGVTKNTNGNTGYTVPGGHTALSGTWRVLSVVAARLAAYDDIYNFTASDSGYVIAQRIS